VAHSTNRSFYSRFVIILHSSSSRKAKILWFDSLVISQ